MYRKKNSFTRPTQTSRNTVHDIIGDLINEDEISVSLFKDIYQILGVDNQVEAGIKLNLRSSAFSECIRKGHITDEIYVALAKKGIDIRELIPKNKPKSVKEILADILKVEATDEKIIHALDISVDDIKKCEELEYITDKILMALTRKGYDIRKLWQKKKN